MNLINNIQDTRYKIKYFDTYFQETIKNKFVILKVVVTTNYYVAFHEMKICKVMGKSAVKISQQKRGGGGLMYIYAIYIYCGICTESGKFQPCNI